LHNSTAASIIHDAESDFGRMSPSLTLPSSFRGSQPVVCNFQTMKLNSIKAVKLIYDKKKLLDSSCCYNNIMAKLDHIV